MTNMIIPAQNPATTTQHVRTTVTFDGTEGGGQASSNVTVFTVTGRAIVQYLTVFCSVSLTEAMATATVRMGSTGATNLFRGDTNAVDIDAGEFWDAAGGAAATARDGVTTLFDGEQAVVSADITILPQTQDVDGGSLIIDCWYIPITDGATIVAA